MHTAAFVGRPFLVAVYTSAEANSKAVNWKLTSDDLARIDAIMTAR